MKRLMLRDWSSSIDDGKNVVRDKTRSRGMEVAENIRFVSSADNLVVRKMTGLRSEKDYPDGYTCKYISIIARNHAAFTSGLPAPLCGQGNCEEGCGREARSQATM